METAESRSVMEAVEAMIPRMDEWLKWTWDGRFSAALAEFSVETKSEVLRVLEEFLVCRWDAASASAAPDVVRDLVKHLGGLMPGQLLLHSDADAPAFLFCAWWPWGNGQTISIRIAPFSRTLSNEEAAQLTKAFREWFQL